MGDTPENSNPQTTANSENSLLSKIAKSAVAVGAGGAVGSLVAEYLKSEAAKQKASSDLEKAILMGGAAVVGASLAERLKSHPEGGKYSIVEQAVYEVNKFAAQYAPNALPNADTGKIIENGLSLMKGLGMEHGKLSKAEIDGLQAGIDARAKQGIFSSPAPAEVNSNPTGPNHEYTGVEKWEYNDVKQRDKNPIQGNIDKFIVDKLDVFGVYQEGGTLRAAGDAVRDAYNVNHPEHSSKALPAEVKKPVTEASRTLAK